MKDVWLVFFKDSDKWWGHITVSQWDTRLWSREAMPIMSIPTGTQIGLTLSVGVYRDHNQIMPVCFYWQCRKV